MWNETIVYAQGPDGGAPPQPQGPGGSFIFIMLAMFAIMYFLLIRPNQKRERERRAMLGALAKGDRVVTNGGVCGTIVGLNEKTVVLKVSDDPVTKIEFVRGAIAQVDQQDERD